MAQDFERTITSNIDTSFADIPYVRSNSDDAIVGIRLVNVSDTSSITVDVKIVDNNNSDADLGFIIKNAPIPVGSSLELIDGGSKIVVQEHDKIQAKSSINNSLDVIVSAVDAIMDIGVTMPYIGNDLATQFQAFATQTITGDGSTGYTLDRAVANGKELLVYINNVKQEEGSSKSYTASGTTITFSAKSSGKYRLMLCGVLRFCCANSSTAPDGSVVSGHDC